MLMAWSININKQNKNISIHNYPLPGQKLASKVLYLVPSGEHHLLVCEG